MLLNAHALNNANVVNNSLFRAAFCFVVDGDDVVVVVMYK